MKALVAIRIVFALALVFIAANILQSSTLGSSAEPSFPPLWGDSSSYLPLANLSWESTIDGNGNNETSSFRMSANAAAASIPFFAVNNRRRTSNRTIFLVHVGKTGGETVRQTLKITCRFRKNDIRRQECWEALQQQLNQSETALSLYTIGTIHCNVALPQGAMQQASTFLWTLRNPLDRVVSWYRYTNPANCGDGYYATACLVDRAIAAGRNKWANKFFSCFPTLQDFGLAFRRPSLRSTALVPSSSNDSRTSQVVNCTQVALNTIGGLVSSSNHMYYNHKFYWEQTVANYPDKEIMVIRTEHLWQDLHRIESLLVQGSPEHVVLPMHRSMTFKNVTHGSDQQVHRGTMSDLARQSLCSAMREELVIYEKLILAATNLNHMDKLHSLRIVNQHCGLEIYNISLLPNFFIA